MRRFERRLSDLESESGVDGPTVIEVREEIVGSEWEPAKGDAPEPSVETWTVVLE